MAFLEALKSVAPNVLVFDVVTDAKKIHEYTYGIKRLAVELICTAFFLAKTKDANATVSIREIHLAFQSADFMTNRNDVLTLQRQDIEMKMVRADLWCPFQSTSVSYVDGDGSCDDEKVVQATKAIEDFEIRTEDALLRSALMPSELAALKMISPKVTSLQPKGKLMRFRGAKVTKADLLDGAAILDSLD